MKTDNEHATQRLKRRNWLGSVATLGAAAVGSVALARRNPVAQAAVTADAAAPEPAANTGYQLTEHVKRYYATAQV
jgi:nitrous oxide reductase